MDKWAFWRRKHRHDGTDSERIKYADLDGAPAGGSGLTAVSTDATLDGDGTSGAPLTVVSAPKLTTARTLALTGDVTGSASFDGSATASIAATVGNDSHTHGASSITGVFGNDATEVLNAANQVKTASAWPTYTSSYTAAKDCLVFGFLFSNTAGSSIEFKIGSASKTYIDGQVECASGYNAANMFCFPLRAGQTLYWKVRNNDAAMTLRYMPFGS